ncbi:T-cell receptor beta chain V region [Pelobates cultripes]|nr:T-cell receptor beta chain V region [Pelobates cultripes]
MEEMSCTHDATESYYMYWYHQKPGEGLVLIAMSALENDASSEKDFKEKWTMTRPSNTKSTLERNGTVNIHDSAMYYCAASYTATGSLTTPAVDGYMCQSAQEEIYQKKICHYRQQTNQEEVKPTPSPTTLKRDIEMKRLLRVIFLLNIFSCLSHAVTVTQNKAFTLLTVGSSMEEMSCTHDGTGSYYMYWYRQKPGKGLVLIAMSLTENDAKPEEEFKENWTMTRSSDEKSTLKRNGAVNITDSAMYYCAASLHSHRKLRHSWHKT